MNKTIEKILSLLFGAMIVFGGVFFIGGLLICTGYINYSGEVPLGDIQDIVVDTSGNIFVETSFYGKVQVYNSEGKFLRNWPGFSGGKIDMQITSDQNIIVSSEKSHKQMTFDSFGKILGDSTLVEDFSFPDSLRKVSWNKGVKYEISGFFFPTIIKTSQNHQSVIVQPSLFLSIINGNLVWCFFICGMFGLVSLKRRKSTGLLNDRRNFMGNY